MSVGLSQLLFLSAALLAIGTFGLLSRRSIIALLMSAVLMLTAPGIALVAFSRFGKGAFNHNAGEAFALVIALVAAVELAVGLSIAMLGYRQRRTLNIDE
jgi:NADH-quinone oxidoreductase subunit K